MHIGTSEEEGITVRIALACSGLGNVRRGFETFFEDLYRHLQNVDGFDVVTFRGAGSRTQGEIPLWNLPRKAPVWRIVQRWIDPYVGEQMTFALSLARRLKRGNYDIVHTSDGQLGSSLLRLFPGKSRQFRILFSNGGPLTPEHYESFDFIHQLDPEEMKRASAFGILPRRMVLLPYGVSMSEFHVEEKPAARRRLGLPEDVPVILTVGAHGLHKRLEFLVRHMVKVGGDTHLLIVGETSHAQTSKLKVLGRRFLGDRVKFVSLPHERMPEAYASADLYVHVSLHEGFGLALIEAMAAGLPLVHHDEPGMNYVAGKGGLAINMADGQVLHETVNAVLNDSEMAKRLGRQAKNRVTRKFSWQVLLPQYMKVYREVLNVPIDN